jgi:hypothetical protein
MFVTLSNVHCRFLVLYTVTQHKHNTKPQQNIGSRDVRYAKWSMKKNGSSGSGMGGAWTGLIWLRIGTGGGLL